MTDRSCPCPLIGFPKGQQLTMAQEAAPETSVQNAHTRAPACSLDQSLNVNRSTGKLARFPFA